VTLRRSQFEASPGKKLKILSQPIKIGCSIVSVISVAGSIIRIEVQIGLGYSKNN
jgi:hypothetical protein